MARSSYNPGMDKNWNPMQEAYRDPHFNSYKDGPGANLDMDKQPCSLGASKEKTIFKLYVGNVPTDVDKEGVENVFRTVGSPIDVRRSFPPANFAFVTFRTFGEAEEARRILDRRPPMNFKIEYARGQEDVKRRHPDNLEFPRESENRVVRKSIENTKPSGKGRGLAVAPFRDPRAQKPGNNEEADIRQFQQYGGSNYDESNTTILKGVQRDNGPGGPKKFVMGRGCFDREMDRLCQPKKLDEVVDNLHEAKTSIETYYQRKNGTFEYSKKEYPPNLAHGTCTYCKKPSTQYCAVCKDWYCSRSCQEKDWPRHRAYCVMSSERSNNVVDGANTNQTSPPRTGKVKEERELGSHQQSNGYRLQSRESLPSDSKYSKKRDSDYTKNHDTNSNDKKKSPQTNNSTLQGKEKGNKKGYGSSSRNGSDESECSFEKDGNTSCNKMNFPTNNKESKFVKKDHQNKFYNGSVKSDYSEKEPRLAKGKYNENVSTDNLNKKLPMNSSKTDENCQPKTKASPPKSNWEKASVKSTNNTKERTREKSRDVFEEIEQLSDSVFTKVTIQIVVSSGEYWIVVTSNLPALASMSESAVKMLTERAPVQLGTYCLAKYDGMWFRAKITSVQPKLRVFFIDFGNEETVTPDEIRMLPDTVKNLKAQAIRIKLAPETSQKYQMLNEGDVLSVKGVHKNNDGIVTVHVEGEVYKQMNESIDSVETHIALQNVTIMLEKDMTCNCYVTEYNNSEFLACLVPPNMINHYSDLFSTKFQEECESLQMFNVVPKIGEVVLAKFSEEGWLRAYLLHISSKKEFTVASCDLGLVETLKEIKKLPPKCREIVQFAVQCDVLEENKLIDLSKFTGSIVVESCSSDKIIAELEDKCGEKCKIEIKKWDVPYELYEELLCVELQNGECVISAEMSPFELYIRPLSNSCVEIYNRLLQDVAKHCFKSPPLKYIPKIGQVLAAQFTEDGNFYRAIVREVKNDCIKVQYIDFGNVEYVKQEALKPLNKTLRGIECCVVKVVLEGVVDRPLNEAVQKLFKDLILGTVPLKVKLSESQSNKVHLFTKDGTDLNEKINKMLIPGWKKGVVDQQIYTIDDVVVERLEFDTPLELVILSVISNGSEVVVRPQRSKVIQVLQNDLQDIIDEYCEHSQEPYTPRSMELCVAKVENTWCRGLCLSGGSPLSIYLLDDGQVRDVTHECIRKYLPEFTALPAVGVRCKIRTNVNQSKNGDISGAIRRYLTTMKVITAKVIQALPEDANLKGYVITVPELDELLKTL